MAYQMKTINRKGKKRSSKSIKLNCSNYRKNKESTSDVYERVHLDDKKTKNKKAKLFCFDPTMSLLDFLTNNKTEPIETINSKNAFSNELYTSPVVLFKTIFSESSNYSSDDYAESKNKQLSYTDSFIDKRTQHYNTLQKSFMKKDSYLNYPTLQSTHLSKTTSSVFRYSRAESLFSPYSINEKIYAISKDIQAKCPGDLSLRYSDRVKLIHQNDEYSLVENIVTGKRGYAPSRFLITLSVFLNNYND